MMMTLTTSRSTVSPPGSSGRHPRLVWLSVAVLLLGLTVGFLAGRVTAPETDLPADMADAEVTTMLDDLFGAINLGDAPTIESLFAENATFTDTTKNGGYTVEGNDEIGEGLASLATLGFRISDPGTAIHHGDYVAQYHLASIGPVVGVYRLNDEGTIQDMWVVQP